MTVARQTSPLTPPSPAPSSRFNAQKTENKWDICLIDCDRLALWLGVEVGFVRRLVAERRIPFIKVGKFVRFDPVDKESSA